MQLHMTHFERFLRLALFYSSLHALRRFILPPWFMQDRSLLFVSLYTDWHTTNKLWLNNGWSYTYSSISLFYYSCIIKLFCINNYFTIIIYLNKMVSQFQTYIKFPPSIHSELCMLPLLNTRIVCQFQIFKQKLILDYYW